MHEKRVRKGFKLSALAGLLALIMVMTAFAAYAPPDRNATGSITVHMNEKSDGTGEMVLGGEMAIYRVAYIDNDRDGNYFFRLTDKFADSGVEIDEKTEEELKDQWPELAQALSDYAYENKLESDDKASLSDGTAVFTDLQTGLYLLVQTEPAPNYYAANPFLVSLPLYVEPEGVYNYDVDASPKTEVAPGPVKNVYTDGDIDRGEDDDDGEDVYVGDILTYKISYTNTHSTPATVTITDVLEKSLEYVSSDPEGITSTNEDDLTVITWVLEDVPAYADGYVTFTAKVTEDAIEKNVIDNTAKVKVGESSDVEVDTNTVHNPRRWYFQIDEEIVTDIDDIFHYEDGGWIKDESVTEYYDIEMEMTTLLPVIEENELAEGSFTMNFHEFLDEELKLDIETAHFSVYLRGNTDDVINLDDYVDANGEKYYTVTFPTTECTYPGEDPNLCAFHVDVRLTDLYNDGIITADDLQGNTWITIFFHADLEEDADGDALYGSYSSTVWYEVYDGDSLEHTSNQSVVEVYTYEISIIKYNASRLRNDDYAAAALAGATLGIYADEDCTIPVTRKGMDYTVVSGDDGSVVFFGLAKGTYYVKEISAPSGYILSSNVLTVDFGTLDSDVYVYEGVYANSPRGSHSGGGGGGGSGSGGGGGSGSGGPGSGGSGDGDSGGTSWDLLPLPETGQGWAMLIAVCAMIAAGIGLIVAYVVRRRN